MELKELNSWFINYRKNRDLIFRNIDRIENDNDIKIYLKDGKIEFINSFLCVSESIVFLKNFNKEDLITIIFFNTKNNVNNLIKDWDFFVEFKMLTLFFVNIDSITETKWIIKPCIHNKIIDKKDLKLGINSLASNVEFIEEK
jgi:hypothetical protein